MLIWPVLKNPLGCLLVKSVGATIFALSLAALAAAADVGLFHCLLCQWEIVSAETQTIAIFRCVAMVAPGY